MSSLNPSQRAAVEYIDGPELVIAGAGSGKTRVLTCKIAYLLGHGVKPWNILALTFTNKAAREMKERVAQLVGQDVARYLNMGTFHSVFLRVLRMETEVVGLKRGFTIYDDSDSRTMVTAIIKEMQLDDKVYKPSTVLSRIGMAKNNLITPDVYLADAALAERDLRAKMPRIGDIYRLYSQRCMMANAIDFDDMLLFTYLLFSKHPEICAKYAQRFDYILVDEYQDTNYAQQSIVTLLTRTNGKVCVVGDDAQSIYAFRGANIDNILNFQNIYEGTRLFKLEQNYRSTQNIVGAANCLIRHNRRQIEKRVFSENMEGDKVTLNIAYSDRDEAAWVAQEIARLHRREGVGYGGFAILYRTNAQSRIFEDELRRDNIPYRIYGGLSFYQRKEIKDIVAYFRLVANPSDEEALKRVINYPKRGVGLTSVGRLVNAARQRGESVWDIMDAPSAKVEGIGAAAAKRIVEFRNMMQAYIDLYATTDAYVLGKRIIEETGLAREIFNGGDDDAMERKDNVEEFVSALHDFVDTKREENHGDEVYIGNFLQEAALLTDADRDVESDADKQAMPMVSLMTVHASKGLEFDTVFVVGMEENLFPSPRACEFPRELEEERRLLYVAITRAERRCFLSCAKSRYQYGNMLFNMPSRFLHEIDERWMTVVGHHASFTCGREARHTPPRKEEPSMGFSQRHPMNFASMQRRAASEASNRNVVGNMGKAKFGVGSMVEHQRFGRGKVIGVDGTGENEKATIEFERAGVKTLLLKFAKIVTI